MSLNSKNHIYNSKVFHLITSQMGLIYICWIRNFFFNFVSSFEVKIRSLKSKIERRKKEWLKASRKNPIDSRDLSNPNLGGPLNYDDGCCWTEWRWRDASNLDWPYHHLCVLITQPRVHLETVSIWEMFTGHQPTTTPQIEIIVAWSAASGKNQSYHLTARVITRTSTLAQQHFQHAKPEKKPCFSPKYLASYL